MDKSFHIWKVFSTLALLAGFFLCLFFPGRNVMFITSWALLSTWNELEAQPINAAKRMQNVLPNSEQSRRHAFFLNKFFFSFCFFHFLAALNVGDLSSPIRDRSMSATVEALCLKHWPPREVWRQVLCVCVCETWVGRAWGHNKRIGHKGPCFVKQSAVKTPLLMGEKNPHR